MSVFENTSTSTITDKAWRAPRITVAQLFLRAVQRWQRARALNELSRLDDRQLDDIGISRNVIPRVVEGLFSADEADPPPTHEVVYHGETPVILAESYPRAA